MHDNNMKNIANENRRTISVIVTYLLPLGIPAWENVFLGSDLTSPPSLNP